MKKIIFVFMVLLGITYSAYADGKRSCSVYGTPGYTAELANGSTMLQANEYGEVLVRVNVNGPKISAYGNGTLKVKVYVNALDRTLQTIAGTGDRIIIVKDSNYSDKASGSECIFIKNLKPGVYYNISIDNATCD